ncbi:hypothetical protein LHL20_20125 [Alteromonas sp. McT4-15]|nr:hypothetical protein [Alteromonas sp. McT4-15]MCB4438539.1 hypothetical protein [Alteromonas sp. McT4-15]
MTKSELALINAEMTAGSYATHERTVIQHRALRVVNNLVQILCNGGIAWL